MNWRKCTGIVIAVVAFVLIAWDLFVALIADSRATISHFLLSTGYNHPAIPLFLGGLMGHLFWTGKTIGPGWVRVGIGACILTGVTVIGFFGHVYIHPACPLIVGFVLGRILVPMEYKEDENGSD